MTKEIKKFDLPVDYTKLTQKRKKDVREEYVRLQNNKCFHCKGSLDDDPPPEIMDMDVDESLFPPFFFRWKVHLHHDHKTGMTIGAVHNRCNAVLWEYFGE